VNELCELAPRLAQHLVMAAPGWRDVVDVAGTWLRHELGISVSLWNEACRIMGRETAALAMAMVSTKPPEHFTTTAGAYFGGMVRRAEKGELRLERSLWKLRNAKYVKPDSRRLN
jgi:replication initiation protein RepC